jgi:outer membrane beta-barrel protein
VCEGSNGSAVNAAFHAGKSGSQHRDAALPGDRRTFFTPKKCGIYRSLIAPLSGSTPRLDDSATYGARYTYHFADQFGVQLSAGYSPSRAAHVASGADNLRLTTADVDLQFDVLPNFQLAGHQFIPYTVAGVGYAWANVDTMNGLIDAKPTSISGSNGYTANAGIGAKYFLTNNLFVDVDSRYRYMNRLVSDFGRGLNTSETTVGVGYRF